jgi:putative tricarboxylic transport membrane protein
MKLSDALSGVLTALFGLAVLLYARTFPPMPGQPIGPALFPSVIGIGLIVFGGALALAARGAGTPALVVDAWVRGPHTVLAFALVVADVVLYALVVDVLGFFITAFLFLAVLFLTFGVPRRYIAPVAAAVTVGIHYGFYTVLRVPLPWGLLEGIAW